MRIEADIDVLKPHAPSSWVIAQTLEKVKGVRFVNITVVEIDQKTTSILLTIKGTGDMSLEAITETLEQMNCAVHSVDRVTFSNWR